MVSKKGFIFIARTLIDSEVWSKKPAWWLKVWLYILLRVNHTGDKNFARGENIFTRRQIHSDCHLYDDRIETETVDNVLRWLRKTTQITTQKTTRGIIIKVVKYDEYQNKNSYKNHLENDTENDTENERVKRDRNETETTQKRDDIQEYNALKTTLILPDNVTVKDKDITNFNIFNTTPELLRLLQTEFEHFAAMRVKIKKPMTDYARKLRIHDLHKLAGDDVELAIAILRQSISASWQDLYALKEGYNDLSDGLVDLRTVLPTDAQREAGKANIDKMRDIFNKGNNQNDN
jgi:hypothetical protein